MQFFVNFVANSASAYLCRLQTSTMNKTIIDIATWKRRAQYEFFSTLNEPFYGITVSIDCTGAYDTAKKDGHSFWLYYLYQSLQAAQQTEQFRYRIEGDDVVVYDHIHANSTVARPNGTFGFGYFDYQPTVGQFITAAQPELLDVQSREDLVRLPRTDMIRYSALPWLDFTALSHASMFNTKDSCPKISFGKMTVKDGERSMPVSINVNHALVDGLHVGNYVECFQELMS
jgi:chloramphenicol O-acetyltransferase type A